MSTNNIKYKTTRTGNGKDVIISIRLNDEFRNGHEDFAITADVYVAGKRGDRNMISCGCCHDDIMEVAPEFKPFIDLHLSDCHGVPMHAISNGFYHLKNSSKAVAINYLRIDEAEYNYLLSAESETYLSFLLVKIGLIERWKIEAEQAIKTLEELTGSEFESTATRLQYKPLTKEQTTDIEAKIAEGYYLPEAIQARAAEKAAAARQKKFDTLKADRDKAIKKINDKYNIEFAVLSAGLPLDNFIYYDHTNEGCFNWYENAKMVTDEAIEKFKTSVDYSTIPEGITFTNKKKGKQQTT